VGTLKRLDRADVLSTGFQEDRLMAVAQSAQPNTRRHGILIADDEAPIRSLLEVALRQQGFQVWLAADGQQALELYARHREEILAILLDVRMPVMDGPQTLAVLRQVDAATPCYLMSGDLGPYGSEKLKDLGVTSFFKKPFSMAEIVRTLSELHLPHKPSDT
jgi:CheY-like chemotaxis protein